MTHSWDLHQLISNNYTKKTQNVEEQVNRYDEQLYTQTEPSYDRNKGNLIYKSVRSGSNYFLYQSKKPIYINHNKRSYDVINNAKDVSKNVVIFELTKVEITPTDFGKGTFVKSITSENKESYPENGEQDGYWYVYQGVVNYPPGISGEDTNLGEKNQPFEIQYSVEDEDITDNVTVTEYLNNRQIRRITNANNTDQTLKITSELLNSCPLGETNTIKIYAEDEKGAGTYRNYWFKRTNTPPYFLEENKDLGTISKAPTITFTAKDDDGDKYLKAKVKINQRVVKVYDQLGNGEQVSFTLDWKDFMQLNHSMKHNLWVEIEDSSGSLATLKYTFEREVNSIEIVANTEELTKKMKLIVFNANLKLADDAIFEQFACNDFGTGNTWEKIQNGVPYEFKNKHAGNDKIGYKCKLTKGTTESEIRSIGGSFI